MTEATAKVIEQTVSGQVPIKINREIPVPCNENAIIPSKDLGPVTTASRSMLQEPDEQPSKNVCLDTVSDEYLDLMHALSPSSDEEEAQNRNLLGEHTEDLKNDFVEELHTQLMTSVALKSKASLCHLALMAQKTTAMHPERARITSHLSHEGVRIIIGVLLFLTVAIRHSLTGVK